jgi:hypothetical protein
MSTTIFQRPEMTGILGLLLFIGCLLPGTGRCQLPPIQLDRPDQTECPFIVPKNYLQLENGFLMQRLKDGSRYFTYPSTLWKYGINERFELRMITELVTLKSSGGSLTGLNPITLGFKANLLTEKGIIPRTSFIGHITTSKWGSRDLRTNTIAPSFRFVMQHTLSEKVSLSYNLGAKWNGEDPEPVYLYTLTSGISLTEKLGLYVELFGFAPEKEMAEHSFDGGFTYLVNNDLMLDISACTGITRNAPVNYYALGLSYRFPFKKQ